jgi:leucyl/phenylalanyl-tRNA---protein transferase
MPPYILDKSLYFPPPDSAAADGLIAVGGDLSPDRLLLAYRQGIFPWYEAGPIEWWCPNPRFVLFPNKLVISKSMRPVLNQQKFRFSTNTAFRRVMENCCTVKRAGQAGTWINAEMIEAYSQLHQRGYAHSAEAWVGNQLVGGLYGIRMGYLFFGESMFSVLPNASKFAFINWVKQLQQEGVVLIDCQLYTPHLESLGAEMMHRDVFLQWLAKNG